MRVRDEALAAVRIQSVSHIRTAAEALRDFVMEMAGLRIDLTHNIASSVPMMDGKGEILAGSVFVDDERPPWWRYPQLGLTSPIAMACRFEAEPFWCNAEGIRSRTPNLLLEALDLTSFEERALTRAAIVAPIHLPFGEIGAASFLSPDPEVTDLSQPYAEFGEDLALLARVFIASYVKITERRPAEVAAIKLSKREVECLRWAAAGKTNEEIAIIIGLKRTTIRFHIRTAAQKLDAVNRDQALFKAAQLGFLGTLR